MGNEPFCRINAWLDGLPRPALFRAFRPEPAFLGMGTMGYYAALTITLGAGLATGRNLLVLSALAAVCAASFFGWALLRKWITGQESYVLMEHLWASELACTGILLLLREPPLPYLDVVSLGLVAFLCMGRLGCLLVGCCHGLPSSVGIVYGEAHAREGFPKHLTGVRLFPVQLVEAMALAAIGLSGLLLLFASPPGRVLAWVLVSYAILRFGLEGIRGDERPHRGGLSQSRWMAIVEIATALALEGHAAPGSPVRWAALGIVVASLLVLLAARARKAASVGRLLSAEHIAEVRAIVRSAVEIAAPSGLPVPPEVRRTRLGVSVGVSLLQSGDGPAHVSLMLPHGASDLRLACSLLARALPEMDPHGAHTAPLSLLHVLVPLPLNAAPDLRSDRGDMLFGNVVRKLQARAPLQEAERRRGPYVGHEEAGHEEEGTGRRSSDGRAEDAYAPDPEQEGARNVAGAASPLEAIASAARARHQPEEGAEEPDGAPEPRARGAFAEPVFSDASAEQMLAPWRRTDGSASVAKR